MKHVSILVLPDTTMASIDGSIQLFNKVNSFLNYEEKKPFYEIELVGLVAPTILTKGIYSININKQLDEVEKTDLIIIPIVYEETIKKYKVNKIITNWLIKQYKSGSEIASLCTGALFLASTGLLDEKKCSTHWAFRNDFQEMFPKVNFINNTIMTEENGIYTSGGAYSYLNLLLHIIEKHTGKEISLLMSKMFQIDTERKSQNQFVIFTGQKMHGNKDVLKVQSFIENNSTKKITAEEIYINYNINKNIFEKKFKKCTGYSVAEYIQLIKVESAKRQLESGHKSINEVIFAVGYNDINTFREIFKKHARMSIVDYHKKYNI